MHGCKTWWCLDCVWHPANTYAFYKINNKLHSYKCKFSNKYKRFGISSRAVFIEVGLNSLDKYIRSSSNNYKICWQLDVVTVLTLTARKQPKVSVINTDHGSFAH